MQKQTKTGLIIGAVAIALIAGTAAATALIINNNLAPDEPQLTPYEQGYQDGAASQKAKKKHVTHSSNWTPPPPAQPAQQQVAVRCQRNNILGTVVGAAAGGLAGNAIGKGKGRTLATVGGAVGGGYLGGQYLPFDSPDCN